MNCQLNRFNDAAFVYFVNTSYISDKTLTRWKYILSLSWSGSELPRQNPKLSWCGVVEPGLTSYLGRAELCVTQSTETLTGTVASPRSLGSRGRDMARAHPGKTEQGSRPAKVATTTANGHYC